MREYRFVLNSENFYMLIMDWPWWYHDIIEFGPCSLSISTSKTELPSQCSHVRQLGSELITWSTRLRHPITYSLACACFVQHKLTSFFFYEWPIQFEFADSIETNHGRPMDSCWISCHMETFTHDFAESLYNWIGISWHTPFDLVDRQRRQVEREGRWPVGRDSTSALCRPCGRKRE